jgi:hypothetical protein
MSDAIKALRDEITERKRELARYEKALALLEGSENGSGPAAVASSRTGARTRGTPKRRIPARVSEERVAIIEQAIRAFAADHDEFRQVDIRMNSTIDKSSAMALAFEQLRQAGTIRLSRKQGNHKFYRLTEAARREINGE